MIWMPGSHLAGLASRYVRLTSAPARISIAARINSFFEFCISIFCISSNVRGHGAELCEATMCRVVRRCVLCFLLHVMIRSSENHSP